MEIVSGDYSGDRREDMMESKKNNAMVVSETGDDHRDTNTTPPISCPPSRASSKKARGGWGSIKYILGNESFEKLASMGLIGNLTVYLQRKYNLDGVMLVKVYNIWSGSSNVTPLVGAFLSDAYLGKFKTLLYGSIASFLGMTTLTFTAGINALRPASCPGGLNCQEPNGWQLAVLYIGLALLAIGAGGIRPCNIAFGADQFDTRTEKGRNQLQSFFNWWYFSFTVALIIAFTIVVYIQTNISWTIGYAIPAACFFVSITIFLIGNHRYIIKAPEGSVFVDIAKVIVAAFRKREANSERHSLYNPPLNGTEEGEKKFDHTDRFKCFDKAAMIIDASELNEQGVPRNPWRLCSVQQVEKSKLLVGIIPVWVTGIFCFIAMDQMNTFGILQAIQSDNSIGSFKMPPGWLGLVSMISLSIWIFIYESVYLRQAKKRSKKDKRLSMKQRINTGIVMAILCMVVAAIVERYRRNAALSHGSMISPQSILILLPQFALSGLVEAFAAVALMEFFTTSLPESMRTIAGAIFFLSLSIASYLNTALVSIIHNVTSKKGRTPWLGGHDLNQVRLDYFFCLIAALAALNGIYFNLFSSRYLLQKKPKSNDESKIKEEA